MSIDYIMEKLMFLALRFLINGESVVPSLLSMLSSFNEWTWFEMWSLISMKVEPM